MLLAPATADGPPGVARQSPREPQRA